MAFTVCVFLVVITAHACLCDSYRCVRPKDCQDVQDLGHTQTGVYTIYPQGTRGFPVRCEMDSTGAWTVIQRRVSNTHFYKSWYEYQVGFGDLNGSYWLGNQQIHMITKSGWYELRVDLTSPQNQTAYAAYEVFCLGDAKSGYELFIDGYSGNAGDSLKPQNGMKFTTKDRDNDLYSKNCAVLYLGAWWYKKCHYSNLNGLYGNTDYAKGPVWYTWKKYFVPMIKTEMKIRRWEHGSIYK